MLFSIITPCYKSTATLERTFESLLNLNNSNFEWILIDDCSPDDGKTRALIMQLAEKAPFTVKYKFLEENHFGSRSTYEASLIASGEYACILDHDDQLMPDALYIVSGLLKQYSADNIAGVCGRCLNENNKIIGNLFNNDVVISNEGSVRFKLNIKGEMLQFTRVELLKIYFSEMKPGYTNGYCWARISESYNYIYTNQILRIYDTAYEGSYSNNKSIRISYPENKEEATFLRLKIYSKYFLFNPMLAFRFVGSNVRNRILSGKRLSAVDFEFRLWFWFYVLSLPFFYCYFYLIRSGER